MTVSLDTLELPSPTSIPFGAEPLDSAIGAPQSMRSQQASGHSPYAAAGAELEAMQFIIKTVERCNLACPYCYYFFAGDQTYKQRPAVIAPGTVDQIAAYLLEGVLDLSVKRVQIIFHGGEPTLHKPDQVASMCQVLLDAVSAHTQVSFAIQTNGVHLPDAWLEVLIRYRFSVGVSIDGPPAEHDLTRIDHRGRGSYHRTAKNLDRLRTVRKQGKLSSLGTISVMRPTHSAADTLKHLMTRFGIYHTSFLFPDANADQGVPEGASALDYGRQLCDVFDVWLEAGKGYVRQIDRVIKFFQVYEPLDTEQVVDPVVNAGTAAHLSEIVIVQSDGDVSLDDSLIPAQSWRQNGPKLNVRNGRLRDFLGQDLIGDAVQARNTLPTACQSCEWRSLCRGGDLENRFSQARGFDNPSIYCEGLKLFCAHVAKRLLDAGYPEDLLRRKLAGDLLAQA